MQADYIYQGQQNIPVILLILHAGILNYAPLSSMSVILKINYKNIEAIWY